MRLKPVRGSIIGKTSTTAGNNEISPKVEQRVGGSTCLCVFMGNKKAEITTRHFYSIEIVTNQWHIISFTLVICIANTNLWHGPNIHKSWW